MSSSEPLLEPGVGEENGVILVRIGPESPSKLTMPGHVASGAIIRQRTAVSEGCENPKQAKGAAAQDTEAKAATIAEALAGWREKIDMGKNGAAATSTARMGGLEGACRKLERVERAKARGAKALVKEALAAWREAVEESKAGVLQGGERRAAAAESEAPQGAEAAERVKEKEQEESLRKMEEAVRELEAKLPAAYSADGNRKVLHASAASPLGSSRRRAIYTVVAIVTLTFAGIGSSIAVAVRRGDGGGGGGVADSSRQSQHHATSQHPQRGPSFHSASSTSPEVRAAPSTSSIPVATSEPAVKPATTSPTVRSATTKPAVKPATTSSAVRSATTKPAVKPATTSSAVRSATTKPAVKPVTTSPAVRSATTSPAVRSATTKPAVKPVTTSPAVRSATTKPAVKPATTSPAVRSATTSPAGRSATTSPAVRSATTKPAVRSVTTSPSAADIAEAQEEAKEEAKLRRSVATDAASVKKAREAILALRAEAKQQEAELRKSTGEVAKLQEQAEEARQSAAKAKRQYEEGQRERHGLNHVEELLSHLPLQRTCAVLLGVFGALGSFGPSTYVRGFLSVVGSAVAGLLAASCVCYLFTPGAPTFLDSMESLVGGEGPRVGYYTWFILLILGVLRWLAGVEIVFYNNVSTVDDQYPGVQAVKKNQKPAATKK